MDKHLIIHRICKVLHIHHYYENKYGIKEHNKILFKGKETSQEKLIDPHLVYLGFDGLKDPYTLLGRLISESPHFDLMEKLENGNDISDSEYVKRELAGYLDGRHEIALPDHVNMYQKNKENIISNSYNPALIYAVDGKWYAFDGKHRLALCCLLEIPCKCKIIDKKELLQDEHTRRLYIEMKKRNGYTKNINFLKKILEI